MLKRQETQVRSLGWEDPWLGKWQTAPVFVPGKLHRQRILVGYSPWGRKELDTTERLSTHLYIKQNPCLGKYLTIREEDKDFAQPGTVSPGKVIQRHRDVDIVYRGGGDRVERALLAAVSGWRP